MPNPVHVITVPSYEDGLRRTFVDLHRRYTGFINARARTTGVCGKAARFPSTWPSAI